MPQLQDEDIRICELPEAQELVPGMKVAVDSETDGTKQVELLNEITDRTNSIRIEWDGTNITLPVGITWKDVAERAASSFLSGGYSFAEKMTVAYPGSPEYTYIRWSRIITSEMAIFNVTVILNPETYEFISVSENGISDVPVGYLSLVEPAEGENYYTLSVRFNGQDLTGSTAYNTLIAYNKFSILLDRDEDRVYFPTRKTGYYQPLIYTSMPEAGYYRTMSIDSNGIGHKTVLNDMPTTSESDSGKILSVDSNGVPEWIASPDKVSIYEIEANHMPPVYTYPSGADIRSDLGAGKIVIIKLHLNTAPPGWYIYYAVDRINQTTEEITFAPICDNSGESNIVFSLSSSNTWSVQTVSNTKVPASTLSDEGKVLTVNSAGVAGWSTPASGSTVEIVSVSDYSSSTSDLYDYLVSLLGSGKTAILKFDPNNIGEDSYYTVTVYSHTQYDTPKILAVSILHTISRQETGEEIIASLNIDSSGYTWNYRRVLDLADNGTKSESDIRNGKIDITRNNIKTIVTLTSVSALTLNASFYGIPNLVIELDNTGNQSNVTLTLKDGTNNTMRHSTSAGNVAQAGKYYQITAVGNCWTMAEFSI